MSSLNATEKRDLEKLFQMGTGYVLGFSNRTFREFVLDVTGLDIDEDHIGRSGSKANRLRYFWSTQPDGIVGKLLKHLVDYIEEDSPLKKRGIVIANRLLEGHRVTMPADEVRIWREKGYRVFVSHKADVKVETGELKKKLEVFGISAFVAHVDIEPSEEWQREIETALASMQAFVALLTPTFHDSKWTDQEVGYALARGVPIIAVKLGLDPYGFIGKFQALQCGWPDAPLAIAKLLIRRSQMLDAFVDTVIRCANFDEGNILSQLLPSIKSLTEEQTQRLVTAFNGNLELQGSYGFNGSWNSKFGPGLAKHLSRISRKNYAMSKLPESSILHIELVG